MNSQTRRILSHLRPAYHLLCLTILMLVTACNAIVYDVSPMKGPPPLIRTSGTIQLDELHFSNVAAFNANYLAEARNWGRSDFPGLFIDGPNSVRVKATIVSSRTTEHELNYFLSLVVTIFSYFTLPVCDGDVATDTWRLDFLSPQTGQVIHTETVSCSHESYTMLSVFFPSSGLIAALTPRQTSYGIGKDEFKRHYLVRSRALVWAIAREVAYHHESP